MAFTHRIGASWGSGADSLEGNTSYSGELEVNLDLSVPDTDELESVLAIDVSEVESIFILSDQDMTLKTNSTGAPDNTLSLKANMPYIWGKAKSLDTLLLTVDVASIFLTQTSGSTATLKIRTLVDSTP